MYKYTYIMLAIPMLVIPMLVILMLVTPRSTVPVLVIPRLVKPMLAILKLTKLMLIIPINAPPSSLLGPKKVQLCWRAEVVGTWCRSQLSALEGVEGACWGSGITLGRGTSYSLTRTCIKPTNKLVSSHSGTPLVLGQTTGNTGLTWLTTAQTRGKPPPSPI
jgi:hypothetical protein